MPIDDKNMVTSNRGAPDSGSPSDEVTPNNELIIGNTDTDTDDEENPYNGYEPLPMNDFNDITNSDEDTGPIDMAENATPIDNSLPPLTRIEDTLVKSVWSGPAPREVDIEMDSNKVNEVKQAMLNVVLPSSSIPEWASNIPEDEWKQQLMDRLQNIHKSSSH